MTDNNFDGSPDFNPDFNPDTGPPFGHSAEPAGSGVVRATPFVYRDPSQIPKRQWLYNRHLIRKFVSVTIAPGGVGKTALKIVEALAMASGRDLLNAGPIPHPLAVWLYNLEDPAEEMERRIAGGMMHYRITPKAIEGRLFVDSGRDQPLVIAEPMPSGNGAHIIRPKVDQLVAEIIARKVDALIVDPFVSCHSVNENDNGAIDAVAKEWGRVADATGCAIELVHHSKKTGGREITAESSRGAVALISAARSVMVLNPMTAAEGDSMGIEAGERRRLFRADADKTNLAPPGAQSDWYRLASIDLGNGDGPEDDGDSIGVVERFYPPHPMHDVEPTAIAEIQEALNAGDYRENAQSAAWAGNVVAQILDRDLSDPGTRKAIGKMIKIWVKDGSLRVVHRPDNKSMPRPCLVGGGAASSSSSPP